MAAMQRLGRTTTTMGENAGPGAPPSIGASALSFSAESGRAGKRTLSTLNRISSSSSINISFPSYTHFHSFSPSSLWPARASVRLPPHAAATGTHKVEGSCRN